MKKIPFDELIPDEYKPYYFMLGGVAMLIAAFLFKSKKNLLANTGIQTEGIVFSQDDLLDVKRTTTVRFVTEDKRWITGKIKQDFQLSYIGQYKNGQKVNVFYEKCNPSNFYVATKQNQTKGRFVVALMGLTFIGFGIYRLYT